MIGLIVLLVGVFAFCALLYACSVYALPFAVGLWVAFEAMYTGIGEIVGFALGALTGVILFLVGRATLHTSQSHVARWLISMVFAAPAGFTGFSAVQQIWPLLLPATTWQYVASIVAAAAAAGTVVARLASRPAPEYARRAEMIRC